MYKRIWPSAHKNIVASIIAPVKIQNKMSSIYIIIFGVLKLFLVTLKKSNNNPIIIPDKKNDITMYN